MCDFDEAFARFATDALRRRVCGDQLGLLGLELLELVHQAVEFRVADLRIIEHVIAVLVMPDVLAQRLDFVVLAFRNSYHSKNSPPSSERALCALGDPGGKTLLF